MKHAEKTYTVTEIKGAFIRWERRARAAQKEFDAGGHQMSLLTPEAAGAERTSYFVDLLEHLT